MDLEGQGRIKYVVEQAGTTDLVAVLGANSPTAVEMTALTLKSGDPSYAGPLTGVALGIQSFHILEPEIVAQVPRDVFDRELALPALAMDVDDVVKASKAIRDAES